MPMSSRQSKAHFEFETFQDDKREGRYIPSSASRHSSKEKHSRRSDHISYVDAFPSFERKVCRFDSFVSFSYCNERMRQKDKENRTKERQEMIMRENERVLNEIERRKREKKEKRVRARKVSKGLCDELQLQYFPDER
ncbi:hypothetical protein J1N35_021876 [Gossypium stocksii]|uniref:Uncharacterized protein n=1 Tax=Gossypium stocksii TaxID=47602 RepID=A0A9D3VF22_9ROSI|nr:hypothetical protein J1N35_021876 [Gossypium stocksii]